MTVSVEEQWAFKKGSRTPAGITAGEIVWEKEKIEEHLGHLATAEEAAAIVLRDPDTYHAHRAFAPKNAEDALRDAMEYGVRSAWSSIIRVKVQITETRTETGRVTAVPKRVPNQTEIRWFHAVPSGTGNAKVYDTLENIAANPDQETALSQDLADQARAFAVKVQTVTAELARLHQIRNQQRK